MKNVTRVVAITALVLGAEMLFGSTGRSTMLESVFEQVACADVGEWGESFRMKKRNASTVHRMSRPSVADGKLTRMVADRISMVVAHLTSRHSLTRVNRIGPTIITRRQIPHVSAVVGIQH